MRLMAKNLCRPRELPMVFAAAVMAAGLLALGGTKPAWAAEPNFAQIQHYPVGSNPTTVTNADFNNDGKADLAAQNAGANTVSVLLGNGDGTFQDKRDFAVGFTPTSVTSADFDGDGFSDLAVANQNSNSVSVLLGNGDGTFDPRQNFAAGSGPTSVITAHLNDDNADGKVDPADIVDLAVANFISDNVTVLLGNGDGSFKNPQPFSTRPACPRTGVTADCPPGLCFDFGCVRNPVIAGPNQVVAADFNRDGRVDLATASVGDSECDALRPLFCTLIPIPGGVSVLLGNPDGTFQDAKRVKKDARIDSLATEDFNGDTKTDLVVTEINSNAVSVMPGNGDGTFQPEQRVSVGTNPSAVTSANLDADAKADLAVTNFTSDNVSILFNNGSGAFRAAQNFPAGEGPIFVTSAHFNDDNTDGKVDPADIADLAVANQDSNSVSVLGPPPPPETTITRGPSGRVAGTSATFEFSSSEPGSTFQCALDDPDAYSPCTSPRTVPDGGRLADGPHTFHVKATGGPANIADPSPATRTWTVDAAAPTVASVSPADAAREVDLVASVQAAFSEGMDPGSISERTFTLTKWQPSGGSSGPVAARVTYNDANKTATLTPAVKLDPAASYIATIKGGSGGVKDLAGNPLAGDYPWTFVTREGVAPSVPVILSPDNDSIETDGNLIFSGTADEGSAVELFEEGVSERLGSDTATSGSWSITLSDVAEGRHIYTARAVGEAGKTSGPSNALTVFVRIPPLVDGVSPPDEKQNVALDAYVEATFSEAMDQGTLTSSTFTLTEQGSSTPVAARVGYNNANNKVTLDPDSPLEANTPYTATVKGGDNGAKDLAGNALERDHSWTFTTVNVPLTVVSYSPTQTAGVPRNTRPTATFSADVDTSTITPANVGFQVHNKKKKKWTNVSHTVSYDAASKTVTVVPGSILAASKKYRVIVATSVTSRTGSALDQNATTPGNQPKSWTFITGSR